MELGTVDYAVLAGYVALLLGVGVAMTTRIRGFADYFTAGGMLTTPLLVCTLVSSYYGLEATFSTSEIAFEAGLVAWFWFARPYYLSIFLSALVVSRLVRRHEFQSLPDVLEASYGRPARLAGAVACFTYSLPVVSISGLAILCEALGWPKGPGMTVALSVCIAYTFFGGLWADAVTDTIKFILTCGSMAVAIPFALELAGGWSFTNLLPEGHLTTTGGTSPWLLLAYASGALTVFVEPAFYQRIFAARDDRTVRNALLIGLVLWASFDWALTLLGMLARSAVAQGSLPADTDGSRALLAVCLVSLPMGLKGVFIGGILATAMSAIDSYALLASTNLIYDLYRPLARRPLSDRSMLRLTRLGVLVVTMVALAVAQGFERIADAWVFMAGVLVSVVFVPAMGAILGRPKPAAGVAASVGGLATLVAFHLLVHGFGEFVESEGSYRMVLERAEIWREYAILAAVPASLVGFALGQFFGRKPPRDRAGLRAGDAS